MIKPYYQLKVKFSTGRRVSVTIAKHRGVIVADDKTAQIEAAQRVENYRGLGMTVTVWELWELDRYSDESRLICGEDWETLARFFPAPRQS